LINNGGTLAQVTKHGLTPVHVAALGDNAYPLAYLHEKGFSMDEKDNQGYTPLHWACYKGGEEAIYYLLAWLKNVNIQDNKGKTALHISIENVTKFDKLRPIKEMLIKGASRELRDNNGNTAYDILDVIEDDLTDQIKTDL
jgi:ankyrin repeat protein